MIILMVANSKLPMTVEMIAYILSLFCGLKVVCTVHCTASINGFSSALLELKKVMYNDIL